MRYSIQNKLEIKRKTSWTKKWPVILLLGFLLFFSARAAWRAYQNKKISFFAATVKKEEFEKLKQREEMLIKNIKKLSTKKGQEEELRNKFGLIKSGEQIAIIIESETDESVSDNENKIWQKVKFFFIKLFER